MKQDVKTEVLPSADKLLDAISGNEAWNPVYRRALEETLKSSALRAGLREVLVASDDLLKNIGLSDLTDEVTIKKSLRTQGIAAGLVQAVELLCALASSPENENAQEEN